MSSSTDSNFTSSRSRSQNSTASCWPRSSTSGKSIRNASTWSGSTPNVGFVPDVDRRGYLEPSNSSADARVDPLAREQEPRPRPEVRGRVPEALAAAGARDDLAVDDVPPSERDARPREVALAQRGPDRGGRHDATVDRERLHLVRGHAERFADLAEGRDRAGGAVPEREVRADPDVHGVASRRSGRRGRSPRRRSSRTTP